MSRYQINPYQSDLYLIYVGYDQPMRTFFATVEDQTIAEDEDSLVLWLGTSYDEIIDPQQLGQLIAGYASIPESVLTQLKNDKRKPFSPSPLQAWAEDLFHQNDR